MTPPRAPMAKTARAKPSIAVLPIETKKTAFRCSGSSKVPDQEATAARAWTAGSLPLQYAALRPGHLTAVRGPAPPTLALISWRLSGADRSLRNLASKAAHDGACHLP